MGSRWFRYLFGGMVLFALFTICRFAAHKPGNIKTTLTASELYGMFQDNPDKTIDDYGGQIITIEGQVCEILGGDYPESITLTGSGDKWSGQRMVECFLKKKRRYRNNEFYASQPIALNGWVMKDQDSDWMKLQNCRVIAF